MESNSITGAAIAPAKEAPGQPKPAQPAQPKKSKAEQLEAEVLKLSKDLDKAEANSEKIGRKFGEKLIELRDLRKKEKTQDWMAYLDQVLRSAMRRPGTGSMWLRARAITGHYHEFGVAPNPSGSGGSRSVFQRPLKNWEEALKRLDDFMVPLKALCKMGNKGSDMLVPALKELAAIVGCQPASARRTKAVNFNSEICGPIARPGDFPIYTSTLTLCESGAKDSRPQLNALMAAARKRQFDTVIVWRFDRFARSTKHLLLALEEFRSLGIGFMSYQENIDTSSPLGQALFTIVAAVAQLERDLIRERVSAGIRNARASRKQLGRPRRVVNHDEVRRLRADGGSIRQIAAKLGVGYGTVRLRLRNA